MYYRITTGLRERYCRACGELLAVVQADEPLELGYNPVTGLKIKGELRRVVVACCKRIGGRPGDHTVIGGGPVAMPLDGLAYSQSYVPILYADRSSELPNEDGDWLPDLETARAESDQRREVA